MEALWKSEGFTADDFRVFKYQPDPVPDTIPGSTTFSTNTNLLREQDQDKWLQRASKRKTDDFNQWFNTVVPKTPAEDYFALLLPPIPPPKRPTRFPNIVNTATLKRLPITQPSFISVVQKLGIHHAFAVVVDRGIPTISRIKNELNGTTSYVYTFRIEHTLHEQSAMTITFYPKASQIPQPKSEEITSGNRSRGSGSGNGSAPTGKPLTSATHALILGYTEADISNLKRCLQICKASIFDPFTLIKAFMSIERGHRFREVDRKIVHFQNILQNYGRLPFGADSSGEHQDGDMGSEEDPKNLIGLYLEIHTLKIRLVAWNSQITGLKKYSNEFLSFAEDRTDIDPEEYLQRMVEEYEVKINKCEMVLQGASLAFQMETAHIARQDSQRSIEIAKYARADSVRSIHIAEISRIDSLNAMRDGKQMKAIALLTMVFLPGTYIATILAVPVFDSLKNTSRFKPWAWYPILFLPLTAVVLVAYFAWINYYKSESQKDVAKYNIYRPPGMEDVSLTATGKV